MSETKIDGAKLRSRIETPFTNEHFANYCLKMVGQPYWYGTCGYRATEDLMQRKAKQYPSSYPASRMKRYRQDIANHAVVADCIGGAKGYAWTGGGESILQAISDKSVKISSKYGSNGCPDKGANSMFAYAKSKGMDWGKIADLPEIIGLALYTDGHVGYYVGNGYAVEWQGFNYGCMKTKVKARSWKYWYKLPFINYGEASETSPTPKPDATIKEQNNAQQTEKPTQTTSPSSSKTVRIISQGGKVNIRVGNGTQYVRITQAKPGTTYPYIATATNGWNAVTLGTQVGWVSGEYSEIV